MNDTQNTVSSSHVTPIGGNVFLDLGFPPREAERLLSGSQMRIEAALTETPVDMKQGTRIDEDQIRRAR